MSVRRYPTLDGVRGLAACAIVAMHLGGYQVGAGHGLFSKAYLAVDLFFLMSGFDIAAAYEARIRRDGIWPFVRARLIRLQPMLLLGGLILPAYYVAHRLSTSVWLVDPWQLLRAAALGAVYLPSRLAGQTALFPLDPAFWSLLVEMALNVAYAALLPWLSRRVLGGVVVIAGLALAWQVSQGGDLSAGGFWSDAGWGFCRGLFSFPLGVLIWRTPLPRIAPPRLLVLAGAGLLLLAPPLFAVLVGFPLVLIAGLGDQTPSRAMAVAGAVSYPLYALHMPLMPAVLVLTARAGLSGSLETAAAFGLILVYAVGALKLVDEPVRAWLTRLSGRPLSGVKNAAVAGASQP